MRVEDDILSHQVKKMKLMGNGQNENKQNKAHNIQEHKVKSVNQI